MLCYLIMIDRFTGGLTDRFHSVGISGSMKMHQRGEEDKKKKSKRRIPTAHEIHRDNIEKEVEDDAKKLEELEQKLFEVRFDSWVRE